MADQMDKRRQSEIGGDVLITDDEYNPSPMRKLTLQVSGGNRPGRVIEATQPMSNY